MRLDHLSYAAGPDGLASTAQRIGALLGRSFVDGGVHPRFGTRNMTLALAGGTYVSIFSGRVRDMGYDVRPVIAQTRDQIDREGLSAKIIIGSIRHFMDVNESLEAGAHIVTVPPAILRKMLHNPKTDETIREFNTAWANRGK